MDAHGVFHPAANSMIDMGSDTIRAWINNRRRLSCGAFISGSSIRMDAAKSFQLAEQVKQIELYLITQTLITPVFIFFYPKVDRTVAALDMEASVFLEISRHLYRIEPLVAFSLGIFKTVSDQGDAARDQDRVDVPEALSTLGGRIKEYIKYYFREHPPTARIGTWLGISSNPHSTYYPPCKRDFKSYKGSALITFYAAETPGAIKAKDYFANFLVPLRRVSAAARKNGGKLVTLKSFQDLAVPVRVYFLHLQPHSPLLSDYL